jgi:hypothetical protein
LLFFLFQRRRRRRRHFAPRFQIAGARSLPLEAGEVLFVSPPQLEKSTSKQEREREREKAFDWLHDADTDEDSPTTRDEERKGLRKRSRLSLFVV